MKFDGSKIKMEALDLRVAARVCLWVRELLQISLLKREKGIYK
jgi:hypothetical protein